MFLSLNITTVSCGFLFFRRGILIHGERIPAVVSQDDEGCILLRLINIRNRYLPLEKKTNQLIINKTCPILLHKIMPFILPGAVDFL